MKICSEVGNGVFVEYRSFVSYKTKIFEFKFTTFTFAFYSFKYEIISRYLRIDKLFGYTLVITLIYAKAKINNGFCAQNKTKLIDILNCLQIFLLFQLKTIIP